GFALTAYTGLRYTHVSADILFDMRLALYRHLQRLSPRFYARTRLGDILARVNNDVGEIQRVAAESLLAWVGNLLFLAGSIGAMFVYGGHRVIAGTLSLGAFVAFMAYQMRLLQPVQALMGLFANLATVKVSLARVHELLDAPIDVIEPPSPIRVPHLRGAVEF